MKLKKPNPLQILVTNYNLFSTIFLNILSYLPVSDLACNIPLVNKHFYQLCIKYEKDLWKPHYDNLVKLHAQQNIPKKHCNSKSYKKLYKKQFIHQFKVNKVDRWQIYKPVDGWEMCSQCGSKWYDRDFDFFVADMYGDDMCDVCFKEVMKEEFFDVVKHKAQVPKGLHFMFDSIEETEEPILEEDDFTRPEFKCNNCGQYIYGVRYKCYNCDDFDLCGICCEKLLNPVKKRKPFHNLKHVFQAIDEKECYGCNECKMEIRGYRYHCKTRKDYDLCRKCYIKQLKGSNYQFIRYGLLQEDTSQDILKLFLKKCRIDELRTLINEVYNKCGEDVLGLSTSKVALIEEILSYHESSDKRLKFGEIPKVQGEIPLICTLLKYVPRIKAINYDTTEELKDDAAIDEFKERSIPKKRKKNKDRQSVKKRKLIDVMK